jgi:hypothetical protein
MECLIVEAHHGVKGFRIGIETVEKMTDRQIAAKVRGPFRK